MLRRALLVVLLLQGCKDDPKTSIASPGSPRTPVATAQSWQNEAGQQTAHWKEALARCQELESRQDPNCAVVLYVELIRNLEELAERPFPEYPSAIPEAPDSPAEATTLPPSKGDSPE